MSTRLPAAAHCDTTLATPCCAVLLRIMSCCARVAPALLLHVSLLLAMVSGAGLATAARLKWDPTTYIAVRELLPAEYRAAAAVLCIASWTLLALAHVAALALSLPARAAAARRALLLTHAVVMAALVCGQVAWAAWTGQRIAAWLEGAQAAQVAEVLEVREHLEPLLQFLARWHPLPGKIQELIQEAEADAPRNLYVGCAALVLVGVLQPAAALLALLSAMRSRPHPPSAHRAFAHSVSSYTSTDNEKAPLRTAYKNGKLVIL